MTIGSALKQFHAENLGKSTLIIIVAVFAGLTYLIYQTIDGIVAEAPKKAPAAASADAAAPVTPAASPAADAPGGLLPASVTATETAAPATARP